ncbi:NAD(P)/FAD-dependent oxidoreductase [bacterium]|nr:NAD(P)/FAD-dependent oxidoreductase [bacterium]
MEHFDICIIGAGPAGYSAAMRAVDFNKKVCLVEGRFVGGTGIWNGVLTSKTMWELSKDFSIAHSVNRGFRAASIIVDYKEIRNCIIKAAKSRQYLMYSQIETLSNKNRLVFKNGWGSFLSSHQLEITKHNGEKETISADNFIIATGSTPRKYKGLDIDQKQIIDSNGILGLKSFPKKMMIIGAGIIGCEFATIFANFKQTEVHLLDRASKVIPFEDDDISEFVSDSLKSLGVTIHHEAVLREVRKYPSHVEVVLDYKAGYSRVIDVDIVLVSIGREANLKKLNLQNISISVSEKGCLNTDKICKVSDHIYATGDCADHANLVNIAEMEGRYAVESIFSTPNYTPNYQNISTIMFFDPEVAAVGANEKELQKKGISYKSAKYSYDLIPRAVAMQASRGFFKIIISNDGSNRILGMRAAGVHSSSAIMTIGYLINQPIYQIKKMIETIHPHPSITEGILECLRVFDESSIFKKEVFPEYIELKEWNNE